MTSKYGMTTFAAAFGAIEAKLPPLAADDTRPKPVQIADAIRAAIARGEFGQGSQLPGYDRVARRYRVSGDTTKRAYRLLRDQGVLRRGPSTRGHFVRIAPQKGLSNG